MKELLNSCDIQMLVVGNRECVLGDENMNENAHLHADSIAL